MLRKMILLIDDSQILMDITKKILERAGYSVRCASGTTGAREQLIDMEPDAIVLNNELPDGSGFEFCRELRETYETPILFLSNNKEDELQALQSGSSDFLKKPFDYEIFKARLSVLLNVRINGTREEGSDGETDDIGGQTEAPEEASQVIRAPPERKMSATAKKYSYMAAALFLAVALILIGIFISVRSSLNLTDIPGDGVPLSNLPPGIESVEPHLGG